MTELGIRATCAPVPRALGSHSRGASDGRGPAGLLPASSTTFDVGDALTELMKLSSALGEELANGSRNAAVTAAVARKGASDKRMRALETAMEAAQKAAEAKSSGGLFDCITDNLGPAGLLGLCTGAAYIVAADLVAHAVGLEDDKLDLADAAGAGAMTAGPMGVALHAAQLLAKQCGPVELQHALDEGPTVADDDTRLASTLALSVTQAELALAATVASGGTTAPAVVATVGIAISATTQILQESGLLKATFGQDARWVALAGTLAGAAVSMGGGVAVVAGGGSVGVLARTASNVRSGLEAVHDVHQGMRNLRAADYAHEADGARVDAQQQKHVLVLIEQAVAHVVEAMQTLEDSARRTTTLLQESIENTHQTMLLAGTWKG